MEMYMSGFKVELSGVNKLQFKTGHGTAKISVPKMNKHGENNADGLIGEVLHFMIMRHGKIKAKEIFEDRLAKYESDYDLPLSEAK